MLSVADMCCGWCDEMTFENRFEVSQAKGVRFCSKLCSSKYMGTHINTSSTGSVVATPRLKDTDKVSSLSQIKNPEFYSNLTKSANYAILASLIQTDDFWSVINTPEFENLLDDIEGKTISATSHPVAFIANLINSCRHTVYKPSDCSDDMIVDLMSMLNYIDADVYDIESKPAAIDDAVCATNPFDEEVKIDQPVTSDCDKNIGNQTTFMVNICHMFKQLVVHLSMTESANINVTEASLVRCYKYMPSNTLGVISLDKTEEAVVCVKITETTSVSMKFKKNSA